MLQHRLRDLTSKPGSTGVKTWLLKRLVKEDYNVKTSIGVENECKTSTSLAVKPLQKLNVERRRIQLSY